jgi:hypothetical protein
MTVFDDEGQRGELRRGPWPVLTSLQVAQMFKACVTHCALIVAQRSTHSPTVAGSWQKVLKLNYNRIAFVCGRTTEKIIHPLSYLLNHECAMLVAQLMTKDDMKKFQHALNVDGDRRRTDPLWLFCAATLDAYFRAAQHDCKGGERRAKVRVVKGFLDCFDMHYADFMRS